MPGGLFNFGRKKNTEQKGSDQPVVQSGTSAPSDAGVSDTASSSPNTTQSVQQTTTSASSTTPSGQQPSSTTVSTTKTTSTTTGSATPSTTPPATLSAGAESSDDLEKRAGMDILSRLTQRSNKALVAGVNKAKEYQVQFVDTEHVLWGLIQDAGIYQLLSEMKVTPTDVIKAVEKTFKKEKSTEAPKFSPRVKKVLELSFAQARALGYEFISPEHILHGLVLEGEGVASQVMRQFGITDESLKRKLAGKKDQKDEQKSATSEFATDLTQRAREGKLDPVVARSKEIERIMHILSRRTKNNPVLIGEAGVGKTAIVEGLAQRIVTGNVPETLKNKRILSLDLTSLIAGAGHRGEFEKRFKELLDEIQGSKGQIILFIDEIHNMVGAGASGGTMDASNILKPSLARGDVQTIGATTITEYRKYIEKDRALERRFQQVLIPEPTQDQALLMVRALKDKYEAFHKVSISEDAMLSAVRLSARYVGDRSLPDKAVDLIDEAASLVKLPAISLPEEIQALEEKQKRLNAEIDEAKSVNNQVRQRTIERELTLMMKELDEKKKEFETRKGQTTSAITTAVIQEVVSDWTGIPISRLTESESEKLVNLEKIIHEKLIDQEQAVSAVAEAVRRGRAGLASRSRPIGSFIFMGPTGVGKTELAKVLAEELFGSKDMMVRLDMTEYMEKHEVAKLIGAPPGYVGYEEGGQLTEAVRRLPYAVVLLDEIEKAHPDVFNILLQILDDGRLTDNKGRTISLKNTILICTSNLGSGKIQEVMMKGMKVGPAQLPKPDTELITTYTISPTGREIVTKKKEVWEKDQKAADASMNEHWARRTLADYFKGQKINVAEELKETYELPEEGFDTHIVFPSGEEMATYGHRMLTRKSTIAKEWDYHTLLDQYTEHKVTNAHPDNPGEQFPTGSWQTHAVSPTEKEFVGVGTQLWIRDSLSVPLWSTMTTADYIKSTSVEEQEQEESAKPEPDTVGVNPQVAADGASTPGTTPSPEDEQPDQGTMLDASGNVVPAKPLEEASPSVEDKPDATSPQQTQQPPADGVQQPAVVKEPDQKGSVGADVQKRSHGGGLFRNDKSVTEGGTSPSATPEDTVTLPLTDIPWDVHLFMPDGKEIIVIGKYYWMRVEGSKWQKGKLFELLSGDNGPVIKDEADIAEAADDEKFNELAEKLMEELRSFFRPELINRFDEVIVFRPLQAKHMMAIVDLQLKTLERGLEEQEFGFEVTQAAREELTIEGFDPVFGARPLRRTVQRLIENPISTMLIQGKLAAGDTITIDYDAKADEFIFTTSRPAPRQGTPKDAPQQPEEKVDESKPSDQQQQPQQTPPQQEEKQGQPVDQQPPATPVVSQADLALDALSSAMDGGAQQPVMPGMPQTGSPVGPMNTPMSSMATPPGSPSTPGVTTPVMPTQPNGIPQQPMPPQGQGMSLPSSPMMGQPIMQVPPAPSMPMQGQPVPAPYGQPNGQMPNMTQQPPVAPAGYPPVPPAGSPVQPFSPTGNGMSMQPQ